MSVRATWVRRLQAGRHDTPEPVCSEATCAPVRELVGAGAVAWAVCLADELGRTLAEATEGAQAGASEITAQRLGVESAVLLVLASLHRGRAGPPYVTDDGVRQIEDFVQRRLTLAEQWAQIREGHAFITDRLMSACRELTPVAEQGLQLQLVSRVMFDFVDGFAAEVGRVYEESERRWSESVHAARAEALDRVLSGESHDVQDTSRRLSYDIEHRHHVGLLVYRETPSDSAGALVETARRVLETLGAVQTLIVPRGLTTLWAWGNSPRPITPRVLTLADGVKITMGRDATGVDGFRSTHQQAVDAYEVGHARGGGPPVVLHFDDVSLVKLLLRDPVRAAEFVTEELRELARDDAKTADLRTTLLTYLTSHSPQSTANALHVARNTVSYRLANAAELLGRPVDERQLETWTALRLLEFTGRRRTPPGPPRSDGPADRSGRER